MITTDKRWIKQYVLGVGLNGPVYLATHSSANNYSEAVAVKSAQIGSDEYSVLREEGKILMLVLILLLGP